MGEFEVEAVVHNVSDDLLTLNAQGSKEPDLANVLEVLDCARDNLEVSKEEQKQGIVEGDGNDTSDSSSDEDDNDDDDSSDEGNDNERPTNMIDDIKTSQHEKNQKHRTHRGVMQYKVSLIAVRD